MQKKFYLVCNIYNKYRISVSALLALITFFFLVTFVAVLWSIGLVVLDDHKRTECAKNENHYTKSHSYDMM